MAWRTFGSHQFGGLDLQSPPDQSACIDQLNIDYFKEGAIAARSGYESFVAPASATIVGSIASHVTRSVSERQLLVAYTTSAPAVAVTAYDDAASVVATVTGLSHNNIVSYAQWGDDTNEYTYFTNGANAVRRWDGTAFATPAGMPSPKYLTVQPNDNRLVAVGSRTSGSANTSKVQFSDEGDPETWSADNYVLLTPGDGETLDGACSWREYVFVFKNSKFFVFYGNSVDQTGGPVFNYRTVNNGIGLAADDAVAPGRDGVYFLGVDGVYVTTGGTPQKISRALDPFFTGRGTPVGWQGGVWDPTASVSMDYIGNLLYVSLTNDAADNVTFVYDPDSGRWAYWNTDMTAGIAGWKDSVGAPDVYFADGTDVFRMQPDLTTDDGGAIVSRYRTGFYDLGSEEEKRLRQMTLWGSGTVNVKVSRDFGSLDTARSAVLGTAPAIDRATVNTGKDGYVLSHEISATSGAWSVHRCSLAYQPLRAPGAKTP